MTVKQGNKGEGGIMEDDIICLLDGGGARPEVKSCKQPINFLLCSCCF